MKEKTFKGFTKGQIESVFDQLNMYGMELIFSTVEAWQYDHSEDASILREAYDDMFELKKNDSNEENRKRITDRRRLMKSLIGLSDNEFNFVDALLELDPDDVFVNNPYYDESDYESHVIYKFKNEKPYTITIDNGVWVIKGEEIEKLFKMTKFTEDEGVIRFARKLKGMGVEEALEDAGAQRGDDVQILDYVFTFKE